MTAPIATRNLVLEGSGQTMTVEIMQPTRVAAEEYVCQARITPDGAPPFLVSATGSDSVQSLMLIFDAIRGELLNRYPDATWVGLPLELAFPRSIPWVADLATYKEIEAFADAALNRTFLSRRKS